MWNPSVNAIWLRAGLELDAASGMASVTRAPRGRRVRAARRRRPVDPGGARSGRAPAARGDRRTYCRAPVDERVDAGAHAGHQRGVDAQPGGERDRAVQLVAVRPDLGDRGAAADHRHDALVLVVERLGAACRRSRRAGCRPPTRRSAARPSRAGGAAAVRAPGCWRRRRPRRRPARPSTVRSSSTSMRPPRPWGRPDAPASGRRLDAAAPDDAARPDRRCRRRA